MPTQTFYRLPEEKRARLTAAIRRELVRAPFPEISINRIVKDAGIARGSYYQYFSDSDDLYGYLISDYRETVRRCTREALDVSGGDLFAAALAGFDASTAFFHSADERTALRNTLAYRPGGRVIAEGDTVWSGLLHDCLPYVDPKRLNAPDEETRVQILEILLSVLQAAIVSSLCSGDPEQKRASLQAKLAILQRGMLIKDGGNPQC